MNLPHLTKVIRITWDGDVTPTEAIKGLGPAQLRLIEKFLEKNWHYYKTGIPFIDDLPLPLQEKKAAKLLQKIVNKFED